jgi:hypothetical protein
VHAGGETSERQRTEYQREVAQRDLEMRPGHPRAGRSGVRPILTA